MVGVPALVTYSKWLVTILLLNSDYSRNKHKTSHLAVENLCISWEGGNKTSNIAPISGFKLLLSRVFPPPPPLPPLKKTNHLYFLIYNVLI